VQSDGSVSTRGLGLTGRIDLARPPHRRDRLVEWMSEAEVDACVAFGARHVTHLTGYARYYSGPSAVVVGRDGSRTIVVMHDEEPVAQRLADAETVTSYGERGFGINLTPLPLLAAKIASLPEVASARRVGLADEGGSLAGVLRESYGGEIVDAGGALARIQLVRDEDELIKILHSYELCWRAQDAIREMAQPGVSEIELFTAAQSVAQTANGEPIEFLADLLSGSMTAEVCGPIHVASRRVVSAGEPVIADIVVGAHGYWGDTAETHIAGENEEITGMRSVLLEILTDAASELRPGTRASSVFEGMSARILEAFPGGEFPHHGGHGLALTAFEDPHVIPSDHTLLENWMLISLEPGVYMPGRHGARVENAFIVTPDGGVELRDALGAR
jgi:Xaa-Pro aminopeptidase